MSSIPKDSTLQDTMYYSCRRNPQKRKMHNVKLQKHLSIGSYVDDLCSLSPDEKIKSLNKMLDAKFRPINLKQHVHKTLNSLK